MDRPAVAKSSLVLAVVMICMAGLISRCFFNLYLHPLRKIPGPKLAAMTSWPDFYYDVVKEGSYLFEIRKIHESHGESRLFSIYDGWHFCKRVHRWQKV